MVYLDMQKILIDFDGVLSDGKHYIDRHGEKAFYSVHSRDNAAIAELIYEGFEVIIVTSNDSKIIKEYAKKRKCSYLYQRDKDIASYAAVGDSVIDIPMLKRAERAFCPVDADPKVKALQNIRILPVTGGSGVIAEMIHHILT